jgi:hypothetical protein
MQEARSVENEEIQLQCLLINSKCIAEVHHLSGCHLAETYAKFKFSNIPQRKKIHTLINILKCKARTEFSTYKNLILGT